MRCTLEGKKLSFPMTHRNLFWQGTVESTFSCDTVYILSVLCMWKGSHQLFLVGKLWTEDKRDCLASLIYLISRVAFVMYFFKTLYVVSLF